MTDTRDGEAKIGAPLKFTPEQVIEAFEKNNGFIAPTARTLKCAYKTVRNYMDRFPEVQARYEELNKESGEEVDWALFDEAVNVRNTSALIFLAKTKYGYVETRKNLHGSVDGDPIKIEIIRADPKDHTP